MEKYAVVICGGGSTYTPDMLELLCFAQKDFPLRKVVIYDSNEERQRKIGEYGKILFRDYYEDVEFSYTSDKEEAFRDIDFAFVQIRAGGINLRSSDEKIPYRYNCIGQETCGAGGLSYGIRSVPEMIQLITDIRAFSPDSWIINYSNPAAIVAEATKRVFPNDRKIINICDMPTQIMDSYLPLVNKKRSDVEPRYAGLNHYGWFTGLIDKKTGVDVLPEILDICVNETDTVKKQLNEMYIGDKHWGSTFQEHLNMILDYPYSLPNTYCLYYLYPDTCYSHYNEDFTRSDEVISGRGSNVEKYCDSIIKLGKMKETEFDLGIHINNNGNDVSNVTSSTIAYNDVHAPYLIELAISIINNSHDICLVMVENNGIVPNLDHGMMLEIACRIGKYGVEPLHVGEVLTFEKGLLENQYASEKLLVDAIFEENYQKLLQAFTINRIVVDTDRAKNMIDDFIKVNGDYWPNFK
ncbi:family 4 glycosyl hydrolase [Oceanobacillus jeddahense]|uniref:6-phospho-alpha-glucosidase n=1 Tax=Oceanobacillus jeddahense TaxID=1462527 RepID=A0ABY5JLS5_9BACI|nr:6-phospho-alpha-glucosidase [Oceanobacillus jeddahense]UUI01081.1 6-phospho-alpha-glucosidase [Oceanobacillus jeddahense]